MVMAYPRTIPTGTAKKNNDIHIVYLSGGEHRSIHTGK